MPLAFDRRVDTPQEGDRQAQRHRHIHTQTPRTKISDGCAVERPR